METIYRLQYLRGLAAFLVVLSHALFKLDRICEIQGWAPIGLRIDGTFGVDIFFVISGFLMYTTTKDEFGVAGAPSRFLLRRMIRIIPLYWLFIAIEVMLKIAKPDSAGSVFGSIEVFLSLIFVPYGFENGIFRPVVGLGWSLDYEMFFYALFACGLLFRSAVGTLLIGFSLAGLVMLGQVVLPTNTAAVAWTSPILFEFLLGVLLGNLYLRLRERDWILPIPWPFLLSLAVVVVELVYFPGSDVESLGWRPLHWCLATLVVALNALSRPDKGFEKSWTGRQLRALGDSSYSLYLGHPVVLTVSARIWVVFGFGRNWLIVYFALAVLCTLPAAWALYVYVEKPVIRFLTGRLLGKSKARKIAADADRPLRSAA